MSNIECRPKALVIADALKLLDTDMRSPRDGAAELLRQHAEIERLRALTQCQCGDEFTAHDPGKCGNCCAGETAALHAEIERLTAERDEAARIAGAYSPARELQRSLDQSKAAGVEARKERDAAIRERDALRAEADGLHVNMAHLLNALGVPMDGEYMGAAVEQVEQLRADLESLRAQEPVAQPAGWKLVPMEPPPEMLDAFFGHRRYDQSWTTGYRAMLAAAPQPPREVERMSECDMKSVITAWYGSIYWLADYLKVSRVVESACAAAWGVKLKEPK